MKSFLRWKLAIKAQSYTVMDKKNGSWMWKSERQSQCLIQQSPPSSDTRLGPFCLHPFKTILNACTFAVIQNKKLHYVSGLAQKLVRRLEHFDLLENTRQFIERLNWWLLCCDGQMKYPIKAGGFFYAVARIPSFPYVNHPRHDEIFAGLTHECIASYHTLCTSNILGMHKSGEI